MATDSEFWTLAIANRMKAMGAVSGLAISMALAAPAAAQEADAPAQEEAGDEEEMIVVSGYRASLESAQNIKREADTFVDVVTAEDIGALPDRSVAEALQRVPGVNISRFEQQSDPDRFSVEGSGVLIRGLPNAYIRSELNGRDIFSANGGVVLSFNDLSPEMMGRIEVYKNNTADQVEGSIAGLVNLHTRKPLEAPGLHIAGTIEANYGDMAEEWEPGFSILGSNTFDTNIGTFGVQLGYAESSLVTRTDASQLTDPCYRADTLDGGCIRAQNVDAGGFGDINFGPGEFPPADTVIAPKGAGVRTTTLNRDRTSYNGVLQWESVDGAAKVTLEYLRAETEATLDEYSILALVNNDAFFPVPAAGSTWTFDNNGVFQTGVLTQRADGFITPSIPTEWLRFQREDKAFTEDFSASIQLHPTDQLSFNFEVQHLNSERSENGFIYAMRNASDVQIDASGETPQVTFLPPGGSTQADFFTDPTQSIHWFALDNQVRNEADLTTMRADVGYEFDDGGFLRDIKFGARWSDRGRVNRSADFNTWGNLSAPWDGNLTNLASSTREGIDTFSQVRNPFVDFQRGNAPVPVPGGAGIFFGGDNLVQEYLDGTVENRTGILTSILPFWAGNPWGGPISNRVGLVDGTNYLPGEISDVDEDTFAAYARLDFGSDDLFGNGWRLDGNIGVRYAKTTIRTDGEIGFPTVAPLVATGCDPNNQAVPGAALPGYCLLSAARQAEFLGYFSGGSISDNEKIEFDNWLPSLNLKLGVSDELVFRFAVSKGMSRPDLALYRTGGQVYDNTNNLRDAGTLETGPLFAINTGNRLLSSTTSWNYDLSAEWYFDDVGSLTVTGFIKDLDGIVNSGATVRDIANFDGVTETILVNGPTNTDKGSMKGVEIAYQQTYDFLPGFLSGFGSQLTYTYIDPGNLQNQSIGSFSGAGNVAGNSGSTLAGVSEHTVNATLFYEKYGISARAAYNYRSEFLQTVRDVIFPFSPIYVESTGQLDASIFYNITDQIKIGAQGVNLLDEVTRTSQVVDYDGTRVTRSAFRNDRRYTMLLRFSF